MATGKKPFTGNNSLVTLEHVLHQKPVPPRAHNQVSRWNWKALSAKRWRKTASSGTRALLTCVRICNSCEKKLSRPGEESDWEDRKIAGGEQGFCRQHQQSANLPARGMAALLVMIVAAVGAWWYKHRAVANSAERNAIAVLPLQNMNGDFSVDYLRFALADELSSVLTYARTLEVRPSSMTRRFVELDLDPHNVGAQLHVGRLLTGHFARQGEQLTVTLEAVDVASDRLLWQTSVRAL